MYYSKVNSRKYLIRLLKGQKINESIKKFCEKLDIKNAEILGIIFHLKGETRSLPDLTPLCGVLASFVPRMTELYFEYFDARME